MKSRWVVGNGFYLDAAVAAWKKLRPEENVIRIEMPQHADYEFDLSVLEGLSPEHGAMFVAIDERFGNFKRMELMQVVMERGFRLEACISTSAIVEQNDAIGPNAFVGDGALVGGGSRVDYNAVLHAGVKIGTGAHIRSSCWLEIGVTVGSGSKIGAHSIVRMGAVVAPNIKVGKHCELGWSRLYDKDIPSRTAFDTRYEEPIYVYGE